MIVINEHRTKHPILLLYLLWLQITCPLFAFAQADRHCYFQRYDNNNGLSNSSVNCIYQDPDNLLWIGTWDGLNMFDGSAFTVFNYDANFHSSSIGNNVIWQITGDNNKNIWLSTAEGITRYNKLTGKIRNYLYDLSTKSNITENAYHLAVNKNGNLFCYNANIGLLRYDDACDSLTHLSKPIFTTAKRMLFDTSNRLWVLTVSGELYLLRFSDRKIADYTLIQRNCNNIFLVSGQVLALDLKKNLAGMEDWPDVHFLYTFTKQVNTLAFYNNSFWVSYTNNSHEILDTQFKPCQQELADLNNLAITTLLPGSENVLWCGTDGNGIGKIFTQAQHFSNYTTDALKYTPARAFCRNKKDLWVATKGNGIIVAPDFFNSDKYRGNKILKEKISPNNAVYTIKASNTYPFIYIGTDGEGFSIYDTVRQKITPWKEMLSDASAPFFSSVYSAVEDHADTSLWIGTSGYGLQHVTVSMNKAGRIHVTGIRQYKFTGDSHGPPSDIIYSIEQLNNEYLLIGCRYGGLAVFNKKTRQFKWIRAFSYKEALSHNDVLYLFKDSKRGVWIGTSYGLNYVQVTELLNKQTPSFKKLTTADGLPNNTIHAIEQDTANNIWVSTNKGLAKINPSGLDISIFQQQDGLQINEFCDGAAWKDHTGKLFFGTVNGFTSFNAEQHVPAGTIPNLLIRYNVSNKLSQDAFTILHPDKADLIKHNLQRGNTYIKIKVKAISFLNADKSQYAFFLRGYDREWRYTNNLGEITYNNIPPGLYQLEIKWSNGNGQWSQELTFAQFKVLQYIWLSAGAIACYTIVGFALFYLWYSYKKKKNEMQHYVTMQKVLIKKEEEVHNEKLDFFTNITHELQTPLTLISGAVQQLQRETTQAGANAIELISNQAAHLSYLIQQILGFRKADAGVLKNNYQYTQISDLMTHISGLFETMAHKYNCTFNYSIQPNIKAWTDTDKLQKIVFNLLSNAFKYASGNSREIKVQLIQSDSTAIRIIVSNTSLPVSQEQIDLFFRRFFVDAGPADTSLNAGIGLAFARQLTTIMQGSLNAFFADEQIHFEVNLPTPDLPADKIIARSNESAAFNVFSAIINTLENENETGHHNENKNTLIEHIGTSGKTSMLLVENENSIRLLLKEALEKDYAIYEAKDGEEALSLTNKIHPDIIITDVKMPVMDGLQLCRKVKTTPAICHIPIIILSAKTTEEQRMEGYSAGADAYINKPFDIAHLLLRVKTLLDDRRRLQQIFRADNTHFIDENAQGTDKDFIAQLIKIIEYRLDDTEIDAAYLEKEMAVSHMQLYRKLRSLTGMSPAEFIRRVRLKHAAKLLLHTNLTVAEIFYQTGFNNQSYFFREFKKIHHLSPNEYRRQFKSGPSSNE